MKMTKYIITIMAAAALFNVNFARAALKDPETGATIADTTATAVWINSFTVAPVAAVQTEGINGESRFGAGLDLGIGINDYVSIHAAALGYETHGWRGGVVDEVEAYGRAKFASFQKQAIVLTGKGGAVWDPGSSVGGRSTGQDYAIAVGAGLDLNVSKYFSLGADYSIRAWFQGREKDSLLRGFVTIPLWRK